MSDETPFEYDLYTSNIKLKFIPPFNFIARKAACLFLAA